MKDGIKIIFLVLNFCFVSDVLSSTGSAASDAATSRTTIRPASVDTELFRKATKERLERERAKKETSERLEREKAKKETSKNVGSSTNGATQAVPSPIIARSIDTSNRKLLSRTSNFDADPNSSLSRNNDKSAYWKDIVLTYGVTLAATAIHQMGHAFALRALHGESQPINLGWVNDDAPTALSLPGAKLKLPLVPFLGFVKHTSAGKNHLKDIIVSLAGPILGSLASYGIYQYLRKKYPNANDYPYAKGWSKGGIVGQLLNLLPLPGFDGAHILSSFGKWLKS